MWGDAFWSALLLGLSLAILWSGHYRFLSRLMKWVIVLLTVCTLAALVGSFFIPTPQTLTVGEAFDWKNAAHIAFLIAFVGWMPAPMDISIWHSVWTAQDLKHQGIERPARPGFDFYLGYFGTAIMAFCFLALGVRLFYGSGIELEQGAAAFAGQLIALYTSVLGQGFFLIIAGAALLTMLSTVLTCLDAFPRVLAESAVLLHPAGSFRKNYRLVVSVLALGAWAILAFLAENMRQMVDFATTVSFLTTPALSLLSFRVFMREPALAYCRPRGMYLVFVWISLLALTAFGGYYLIN
jgi:hypothetical protein